MTAKIITIEKVDVRYSPKLCGEYDDEGFPGDPCCCLVYDSEMEAFCFKFQGTLKENTDDVGGFFRCAECKKEFGE